jgi:hypothetical protein
VFENRVLRRIFGPKREEMTGGCRNCIYKVRGRWERHVARMEGRRNI